MTTVVSQKTTFTAQEQKKSGQTSTTLTKLTGNHYNQRQHLLILNVSNTNKYTKNLAMTIIQIILFEMWQSRNNNKYDKKVLP